jgi:hypothetical protein
MGIKQRSNKFVRRRHGANFDPHEHSSGARLSTPLYETSIFHTKDSSGQPMHLDFLLYFREDKWRPGVRNSMIPGVRNSISPGVRNSMSPGVRNSMSPGVRNSMSPGVRNSMSLGIRNSMSPGVRNSMSPIVGSYMSPIVGSYMSSTHDVRCV